MAPRSALLLLCVLACARGSTSASSRPSDGAVPGGSVGDLTGAWLVEFRVDSLRGGGGSIERWRPGSGRTARGTLRLSDSAGRRPGLVRSEIRVAFDSALGRPMSCFDPPPTETAVERTDGGVALRFTPGAFDCGLSASARPVADALVGEWEEQSFAGSVATGRFRMTRQR